MRAPPPTAPTTAPPAVLLQGVEKAFGATRALDGLDLSVGAGEIMGLVGPDGAGKTTTLRLAMGLLRPDAGRVTVLGRDPARAGAAVKPLLGYMAQRFALYRDLTVRENLDFFADVFGVPAAERRERGARLLAFSGLEAYGRRRAEQLSGGMQKKLALACTLVHQPRLLFLDEPTTGVDPLSRRELWDILTELHLQGVTIVVSTPYMDEAERCSRVGLMVAGRLVRCAAPAALRAAVPGVLWEVRAAAPRAARLVLQALPHVYEVQVYGDRLHVFVEEAAWPRERLEAALRAASVDVLGLRRGRPRMEEAFLSLVRAATEDGLP